MKFGVTWLGQGGFIFEYGGFSLVVDPYLSTVVERKSGLYRLMPPPLTPSELYPDMIICTHDHLDHYDPDTVPVVMKSCPDCKLAGPDSVRIHALTDGISERRFVLLDNEKQLEIGSWRITALPAQHSDPDAIGLLLDNGSQKVYFSGDTEFFQELPEKILNAASGQIDYAFICINGKYGNMTWREAAKLAFKITPQTVIPMHYGMFAENTVDPGTFCEICRQNKIPARLPAPGMQLGFK